MPKQDIEKRELIRICEGLYAHGLKTPNEVVNLPKGQLTIAQAVDSLLLLIKEERMRWVKEIVGEDEEENVPAHKNNRIRNSLRNKQRAKASKL